MRYSEYEWKTTEDGTLYLMHTKMVQSSIYDPLAEYQKIVLDVINIGSMGMTENPIKLCRPCTKAFVVSRSNAVLWSPQCKNNVYKSRARNKGEEMK